MLKKLLPSFIALSLAASSGYASISEQAKTNEYWWPKKLNLNPLRNTQSSDSPMGKDYNYPEAFNKLDVEALRKDMTELLTTSQDWWPADFGNYGPFFIRLSWHSSGTYRSTDGRGGAEGGMQRFAPLNSWPDNVNLDKARRLLWPIKQKYGNQLSWSDLIVYAGTVSMESMGFKTIGFAFGREDAWKPENINWGSGDKWLASNMNHKTDKLKGPLAATQMGLIYVNPEGPEGKPDPLAAANRIRETFGRMGMNDEETVALIAGGHTFGKAHGAANAKHLGRSPESAAIDQQGIGWKNNYGTGNGDDTIGSGLEGSWTSTPTKWGYGYFANLFTYEWIKTKSPAGATQWRPKNKDTDNMIPDAHNPHIHHAPMMFTTDLSMRIDPEYQKISKRFKANPEEFEKAFAKAWFKLTHRDMGPKSRYLGPWVPEEVFIWQDPVPTADYKLVTQQDIGDLKVKILKSGLTIPELVKTAWASASSYRKTDMRGGANGARIRLLPEKDWPVNEPAELEKVLGKLEAIQKQFNDDQKDGTKISLADLIILGGASAIEEAAQKSGYKVTVPFKPGRTDAKQSQTSIESFSYLEPEADGFINYFDEQKNDLSPAQMLVDKASMLDLNIPEMTVLVGGMRVLNANYKDSPEGVFTANPGALSNDFFSNLLNMSTKWERSKKTPGQYNGYDRETGKLLWQASSVDLIFGSNSELRAVAEVYGSKANEEKFVKDFIHAWTKVMMLGRFNQAKL